MAKVVELIVIKLTPGEATTIAANLQVKEDDIIEILEFLEEKAM